MKEKILAALRAKYTGTQTALLDRMADTLSQTITDESQIETVASSDGVKNLLTFFQSESDRRATEATSTAVVNYEKKHNIRDGKPVTTPQVDPNVPEWAKGLMESNQKLQAELEGLRKGQSTSVLMDRVKSKLAEKKIPELLLKGRTIEKEEDIDTLVTEIETDYTGIKQTMVNEGVVVDVPKSSMQPPGSVDAGIAAWAKQGETKKD